MNDSVQIGNGRGDRRRVEQVAPVNGDVVMGGECVGNGSVRIAGEQVDVMVVVVKLTHHGLTEKTGAACDQDVHLAQGIPGRRDRSRPLLATMR